MRRALFASVLLALAILALSQAFYEPRRSERPRGEVDLSAAGLKRASVEYLFQTYRDPATNSIPRGIHRRVLRHVQTLPIRVANKAAGYTWAEVGPKEYGGRTRAVVPDLNDPDILIAGGVAGGVWRSTDQGVTWSLRSSPGDMLAVTSIAQDPRPGQRNVWYAATGEYFQSASGFGFRAPDFGTGLHKSIDGGLSWFLLPATSEGSASNWDVAFDYVVRVTVSPTSGTLFVADNGFGILRSDDDGATFDVVLGGIGEYLWTDVAVASNGNLVAVVSQENAGTAPVRSPGVYRSTDDGVSWIDTTPASFPSTHTRSVLAIAPSDPDVAYVMTDAGVDRPDGRDDVRMHEIDVTAGTSIDRTANLPNFPGSIPLTGPSVHTQNSYDMVIVVKPDDPDFVVYGGTTLYRTVDGFATPPPADVEATRIGGYGSFENGGLYLGVHHPDNHTAAFHPARPNELLSGNDGGVYISRDVTAPVVTWEDKNDTYNVTQFYTVIIDDDAGDPRIMGGTQDNFVLYTVDERSSGGGFTPGELLVFGDGGFGYFGEQFAFASRQLGEVFRLTYLNPEQTQIEPGGELVQQGGLFIHPFALDPENEQIFYSPSNRFMWRNNDINAPDPSPFWQQLTGAAAPSGYTITALVPSRKPAHVLYFGATHFNQTPRVYRLDDADVATSAVEITVPGSPGGAYVHCIAVNPEDAQEILVVYSNYNVVGLYHSTNAGASYTAVEGDLTGTVQNPGPSLRWASILPTDQGTRYFLATSAGVFSTDALAGVGTAWTLESPDLIGNTVSNYLCSRPSDGRVAVGTHGRGMFVGDPAPTVAVEAPSLPTRLEQNFPNPFNASTTVRYRLAQSGPVSLRILDLRGRSVLERSWSRRSAGQHQFVWHGEDNRGASVASGSYVLQLVAAGRTESIRMSLVK